MKSMGVDIGHCTTAAAYPDFYTNESGKISCRAVVAEGENNQRIITTQMLLTYAQLEELRKFEQITKKEILKRKNEIDNLAKQAGEDFASSLGSAEDLKLKVDAEFYPDFEFLKTLGEIKIGEDVPVEAIDGIAFRYFKIIPEKFGELFGESPEEQEKLGIRYGTLMACFCYAMLNNYIINSRKYTEDDRENLRLIVGCPATESWTSDKAKMIYSTVIRNATGVENVRIVPESRGALFGIANENRNISVADGVLIFDFGSLTADCTYLLSGKRLAEFSWQLGASSIEKEMARLAFSMVETKCKRLNLVPCFDDAILIRTYRELREEKENHFNGKYPTGKPHPIMFKCADGETESLTVDINHDFMDKVIYEKEITIDCGNYEEKTGSWAELCEEFFTAAKNRIIDIENLPVKAIVLTGGASQMGFIAEKCKKVFGIEPICDKNVAYAVAQGLAWVSASEEKLPDYIEKAKEEIRKINECKIDTVVTSFETQIYDFLQNGILTYSQEWLENNKNTTMQQLKTLLQNKFSEKSLLDDFEKKVTEPTIRNWEQAIDKALLDIVNRYTDELYTPELKKSIPFTTPKSDNVHINLGNLDFKSIIDKIDIDSFLKRCWNGTKRVLAIAGSILYNMTINLFVNDDYDVYEDVDHDISEQKKAQKSKELTQKEKTKTYDKIRGGSSVRSGKEFAVKNLLNYKMNISKSLSEILDSKVEKAFRVAMLMDFEKKGWSD